MPAVNDGSERPKYEDERMWWDRGYDTRGANLTCRRCGAVINRNTGYTGDEYWMAHDDFHQQLDERLLQNRDR